MSRSRRLTIGKRAEIIPESAIALVVIKSSIIHEGVEIVSEV